LKNQSGNKSIEEIQMKQISRKLGIVEKVAIFLGRSLRKIILALPGMLLGFASAYVLCRYIFIGY
jgi:hypothetical protein